MGPGWWHRLRAAVLKRRRPTMTLDHPDGTGPRLTIPTAKEMRARAAAGMADYETWLAARGGVLPARITRKDVEKMIRARGFKSRRVMGETTFWRARDGRREGLFFGLKTLDGGGLYAPSQRLTLTGRAATPDWVALTEALHETGDPVSPLSWTGERRAEGFVLTAEDAAAALDAMETALAGLDLDAALTDMAVSRHDAPGAAGLHHLAALALKGEAGRIAGYRATRQAGGDAGFAPFITDAMIETAYTAACDRAV